MLRAIIEDTFELGCLAAFLAAIFMAALALA
jgi:hypothetical protein